MEEGNEEGRLEERSYIGSVTVTSNGLPGREDGDVWEGGKKRQRPR